MVTEAHEKGVVRRCAACSERAAFVRGDGAGLLASLLRALARLLVVCGAAWSVNAAGARAASWTVVPSPGVGALSAVSCTSPSACTVVGAAFVGGRDQPLAERWNGRSFSPEHDWQVVNVSAKTGQKIAGPPSTAWVVSNV